MNPAPAPTTTPHRFMAEAPYRAGHRAFCSCGWRYYHRTRSVALAQLDLHCAVEAAKAAGA